MDVVRQFLLRLFLLIAIVLVIFGVYRLLTIRPLENVSFFEDATPLVAVDSGALTDVPAYSQAAFDLARQAGANGLYLPVALTRDGVLVVTNAAVDGLALDELRSAESFQQILTLQEALDANPGLRTVVVVRQPSLQALAALLQAIDAADARPRVLVAVDDALLASSLRQQAPDLATVATSAETSAFLTTQRFRLAPFYRPVAPAMLLAGSRINERLVNAAHGRGIHLLALPEEQSLAAAQALANARVDGLVLQDPALAAGLRWASEAP